jgi:hypothetical protein
MPDLVFVIRVGAAGKTVWGSVESQAGLATRPVRELRLQRAQRCAAGNDINGETQSKPGFKILGPCARSPHGERG